MFKFGRKKQSQLVNELLSKNIPPLIVDKNWYNMFPGEKKTKIIIEYETELTSLIKEQGKLTNEISEYNVVKKNLLDTILKLTTEAHENDSGYAKNEMSKSHKYVKEINEKLNEYENRLLALTSEINFVNAQLLAECLSDVYEEMKTCKERIKIIVPQIDNLKTLIRKRTEEKADLEERYSEILNYMHKVVGPDIIDMLDPKD